VFEARRSASGEVVITLSATENQVINFLEKYGSSGNFAVVFAFPLDY
jgi:hypothetical protein